MTYESGEKGRLASSVWGARPVSLPLQKSGNLAGARGPRLPERERECSLDITDCYVHVHDLAAVMV